MRKAMDFTAVFLAGAVVGGVAAALMTPMSGRRARRMLRKKVEAGTHQLEQGLERMEQGWERGTRHMRDRFAKVASMGR